MKKLNKLFLVFLFLLFSCKGVEQNTAKSERTLIFSEDFQGDSHNSKWSRGVGEGGKGKWVVKDGGLTISNAKNDPLWLDLPLPEKFEIEFQAESLSTDGDIKVEILGDGKNHASGYVLIFGGWKNQLDVIARLDEHGKDRKSQPTMKVISKKTYQFRVQRLDNELVWSIDGKTHMTYKDPKPLTGAKHSKFAFSNWSAPLRFSKLRIYKR